MIKTVYITCELEYEFTIGQLAEQDIKLVKEATGKESQYIDFAEFYRLSPDFQGEVLAPEKCFQIARDVDDTLRTKFCKPVAEYLMSECGRNMANARVRVPNCPSNVFLYRDGGVCLIILATCSFDVCIDDYQKLDKNSLRNVINTNCPTQHFSGELSQLFNDVQINELEIEYR